MTNNFTLPSLRLPIGYSSFGEIRREKFHLVDKTLLIRDIIDDTNQVILFTRPRRFGKTLNLSMLQHFFASSVHRYPTQGLFDDMNIAAMGNDYMRHQGQYPVIFLTLKDIKDGSFEVAFGKLSLLMMDLFDQHHYLLESPALTDSQKMFFQKILSRQASQEDIENALKFLTDYLRAHHGVPVIILIDEYDTPIQSGYLHGYYPKIVGLIRNLFSTALKDNSNLYKAVLTGILRVSKESLFSGLNQLSVYSILNSEYGKYFGFTESEVSALLTQVTLIHTADEIKRWYNGYRCGDVVLYNPWSIVNCINRGDLRPYWVNTSDNQLLKELLQESSGNIKQAFEQLLQKQPMEQLMDEYVVLGDTRTNESALWNLFLCSGYLKAVHTEMEGLQVRCRLDFPNQEVEYLYIYSIRSWFTDRIGELGYQQFLARLLEGRLDEFSEQLQQFLLESASTFDISGHMPEKFYHGFVLGLIASLSNSHTIKSNRESGYGRYDAMIIPHDHSKFGVIMEFKSVFNQKKSLVDAAQEALQQVVSRQYDVELKQLGINHIIKMGLAFRGQHVETAYTLEDS